MNNKTSHYKIDVRVFNRTLEEQEQILDEICEILEKHYTDEKDYLIFCNKIDDDENKI